MLDIYTINIECSIIQCECESMIITPQRIRIVQAMNVIINDDLTSYKRTNQPFGIVFVKHVHPIAGVTKYESIDRKISMVSISFFLFIFGIDFILSASKQFVDPREHGIIFVHSELRPKSIYEYRTQSSIKIENMGNNRIRFGRNVNRKYA